MHLGTIESLLGSIWFGIAAFAASGLYASVLHDSGAAVAVFHPHMLLVARRAGFWPTLFTQNPRGEWVKA